MKHKPAACMKQQLRCREAKRAENSTCGEAMLHRAKPCFIFHARQRASLKKALARASAFFCVVSAVSRTFNAMRANEVYVFEFSVIR